MPIVTTVAHDPMSREACWGSYSPLAERPVSPITPASLPDEALVPGSPGRSLLALAAFSALALTTIGSTSWYDTPALHFAAARLKRGK
jgi:hypothetical protein